MKSFTEQEKKQLVIFSIFAFAVPYLLGILMWYGRQQHYDMTGFVSAQMFYPAAGVMVAVLATQKTEKLRPKRFMITYCLITVLMLALAVSTMLGPNLQGITLINLMVVCGNLLLWIMLLTEEKVNRKAYGLTTNAGKASVFCICLFLLLYTLRMLLSYAFSGAAEDFFAVFKTRSTWLYVVSLPINFSFLFAAYFGEEYGWRYFLQPLMQKRFGLIGGVLFSGMLWGLWHLPLDLFYYSAPGYGLMSVLGHQITCIALGIFMSYAYMKTDNIWVPVILHFLNNNLIPVFTGFSGADVIANQTMTWGDMGVALVLNSMLFGLLLLAKPFRCGSNRPPTLAERLDRTIQSDNL